MIAEVRAILEELDRDVAGRKPVCQASGKCCKFEEYGHRLYVTRAELMYFAATVGATERRSDEATKGAGDSKAVSLPMFFQTETIRGCPYQVDGLCTARDARPMGCRVYFCDANSQSWLNEVYERYHAKLRALHEKYKLPYEYMEWRFGLKRLMEGTV